MDKVYILVAGSDWHSARFFSTKEKAIAILAEKKKDIKTRRPDVLVDTDTKFEFIFGWAEHHVVWRIVEQTVE